MKNKITLIIIVILILTNILLYIKLNSTNEKLTDVQTELSTIKQNKKVAAFQKLFIDKVLMSNGNVDFNTRVELQNAVTDINDQSISKAWDSFLSSKTENDAQLRVKELLSMLASKIY